MSSFYDFQVLDSHGTTVSMEKYRGLVVIVVNVASFCGLTNTNYQDLKKLNDKYYNDGLRVAAFPCNQFMMQEPTSVEKVCTLVKDKFDFEPDMYEKIQVNDGILGGKAEPLWQFLKNEQGGSLFNAIKWNFTKFLINRQGKVVARHGPSTPPSTFEQEIVELLKEKV